MSVLITAASARLGTPAYLTYSPYLIYLLLVMPKRTHILVKLGDTQPDCCAMCPLCGLIPQSERQFGSREGYVCLGTQEAISTRGITLRASQASKKHPLRRPCDKLWEQWLLLPKQSFPLNARWYNTYRIPYEQGQQMIIKFHGIAKNSNI